MSSPGYPTHARTRSNKTRSTENRVGVTLLEVVFASALFAMGMASLLQLMQGGARIAMRAELESLAAKRCESIVSMVMAEEHVDPASFQSRLNNDRDWETNIQTEPSGDGLTKLTVVVSKRGTSGVGRFELTRLIRNHTNQINMSSLDTDREGDR